MPKPDGKFAKPLSSAMSPTVAVSLSPTCGTPAMSGLPVAATLAFRLHTTPATVRRRCSSPRPSLRAGSPPASSRCRCTRHRRASNRGSTQLHRELATPSSPAGRPGCSRAACTRRRRPPSPSRRRTRTATRCCGRSAPRPPARCRQTLSRRSSSFADEQAAAGAGIVFERLVRDSAEPLVVGEGDPHPDFVAHCRRTSPCIDPTSPRRSRRRRAATGGCSRPGRSRADRRGPRWCPWRPSACFRPPPCR